MRRNIILILTPAFLIAVLVIAFLNNRAVERSQAQPSSIQTKKKPEFPTSMAEKPTKLHNNSESKAKKSSQLPYAYTTGKIICPLKIEPMLYVEIKISMSYADKNLQSELNFKREHLEAVIQNILYQCERKDLKAEILRNKILHGVNGFLETGIIENITFKDFKIEIRKK